VHLDVNNSNSVVHYTVYIDINPNNEHFHQAMGTVSHSTQVIENVKIPNGTNPPLPPTCSPVEESHFIAAVTSHDKFVCV
jgi:hypothetical protein